LRIEIKGKTMDLASIFSVKGKNVLVTGGGQGIGRMIAEGFVTNGATVYICSRNQKEIEKTCSELSSQGSCTGIIADLATMTGIEALHGKLLELKVAKLHVLVNNSGTSWGEPIESFQEKGWDRVMNLNVKGLFFLTKTLLPLLQAAGTHEDPARVINIGSVAGLRAQTVPTYSYDVSKAAVHHLTKKLASDLSMQHITVNAIAPGLIPSNMSKQLLTYASEAKLKAGIPLGRVGKPQDMAGAALYLSSQAGAWVTGVVLPVDGGYLVDVRPRSKL
jgi:NAD(P)-dependent dehydrogenase (short-subunit alcohol dehydrogenase family)